MNILFLLLLHSALIIAPKAQKFDIQAELNLKKRNLIVNILINKLIAYIRHIITHGSAIAGIPTLDPFELEDFHLILPTGLFDLDIRLENVSVTGFGGFVMHKNNLHLSNLTFEIEVSLPRVVVSTEKMHISEIDNGFTSTIPMYSKDKTEVKMDHFRLQAYLQLKQSDDLKSILIDKIENAFFDIPSIKINSDGIIDEENLEAFTEIEESVVDYLNRCKDAVTVFISNAILTFGNPILNQLDTWRYIGVLL